MGGQWMTRGSRRRNGRTMTDIDSGSNEGARPRMGLAQQPRCGNEHATAIHNRSNPQCHACCNGRRAYPRRYHAALTRSSSPAGPLGRTSLRARGGQIHLYAPSHVQKLTRQRTYVAACQRAEHAEHRHRHRCERRTSDYQSTLSSLYLFNIWYGLKRKATVKPFMQAFGLEGQHRKSR